MIATSHYYVELKVPHTCIDFLTHAPWVLLDEEVGPLSDPSALLGKGLSMEPQGAKAGITTRLQSISFVRVSTTLGVGHSMK
jgi:hypothetical protein